MAVSARLPDGRGAAASRDLAHMKRVATGLLVGATVVFLVTRALEDDVLGPRPTSGPRPRRPWSARWPTGSR